MNAPEEQKMSTTRTVLAGTEVPALFKMSSLCFHFGVNSATIWRWIREHNFPEPIEVGLKMRYWKTTDVDEWLNSQNKINRTLNKERRLKLHPKSHLGSKTEST